MLNLSFSIEGEKQVSARLRKISGEVKNWHRPFKEIGKYLEGFFGGEVFNTKGAVIGEPWKPLSEATKREKARKGYPTTPLIRSGEMKRGFTHTATPKMVAVWNTQDYFKYHQSNQPRRSNLPRRAMMKLDEIRRQIIIKKFHNEFERKLGKADKTAI